jgi:hypothetical protein
LLNATEKDLLASKGAPPRPPRHRKN